jgi:hypothetical protein
MHETQCRTNAIPPVSRSDSGVWCLADCLFHPCCDAYFLTKPITCARSNTFHTYTHGYPDNRWITPHVKGLRRDSCKNRIFRVNHLKKPCAWRITSNRWETAFGYPLRQPLFALQCQIINQTNNLCTFNHFPHLSTRLSRQSVDNSPR